MSGGECNRTFFFIIILEVVLFWFVFILKVFFFFKVHNPSLGGGCKCVSGLWGKFNLFFSQYDVDAFNLPSRYDNKGVYAFSTIRELCTILKVVGR